MARNYEITGLIATWPAELHQNAPFNDFIRQQPRPTTAALTPDIDYH
jgi:hypothetical protein